jgi:hypothetical protein
MLSLVTGASDSDGGVSLLLLLLELFWWSETREVGGFVATALPNKLEVFPPYLDMGHGDVHVHGELKFVLSSSTIKVMEEGEGDTTTSLL